MAGTAGRYPLSTRRLGFGFIEACAEAHAEGLKPRVLRVHGQFLADDVVRSRGRSCRDHQLHGRAPHLRIGAELRTERALDLCALADVHAGPVHDLHVFRVDPSDRVGREGPGFAPDANDRLRAGLGGGGEEGAATAKAPAASRPGGCVALLQSLPCCLPSSHPMTSSAELESRSKREPASRSRIAPSPRRSRMRRIRSNCRGARRSGRNLPRGQFLGRQRVPG